MTLSIFFGLGGSSSEVSTELGRSSWSTKDQDVLDMLWFTAASPQTLWADYSSKTKPSYVNSIVSSLSMPRTLASSAYTAESTISGVRFRLWGRRTGVAGSYNDQFTASIINDIGGRFVNISGGSVSATLSGTTYTWSVSTSKGTYGNTSFNLVPQFSKTETEMFLALAQHGVTVSGSINLT